MGWGEEGAEQAASRCRGPLPGSHSDLEHQKEEYGGVGGDGGGEWRPHSPTESEKGGKPAALEARKEECWDCSWALLEWKRLGPGRLGGAES